MDKLIIKDLDAKSEFLFMLLERVGVLEEQSFLNIKENDILKKRLTWLENSLEPPHYIFKFHINVESKSDVKISDYIHNLKERIDKILSNIKTSNGIIPLLKEIRISVFETGPNYNDILPKKIHGMNIILILDTDIYLREFNDLMNQSFDLLNRKVNYCYNIRILPRIINSIWIRGENCYWMYRVIYFYSEGTSKVESCPIVNIKQSNYLEYIKDRTEYVHIE